MNYQDYPNDFYTNRNLYWLYATKQELLDAGVHPLGIWPSLNEECVIEAALTEEEAHSFIPKNTLYCYSRGEDGTYKQCPFWDKILQFPKQANGFCHFLKQGDFSDDKFSLLWDSCKECGISDDIEFETHE